MYCLALVSVKTSTLTAHCLCIQQDWVLWHCVWIRCRAQDQSPQCSGCNRQHWCTARSLPQNQVSTDLSLTTINTAQQNCKLTNYGCLWVVCLWQSFSSLYRLNRASQTYLFPIHLTDQILPSAVFYATVGPLAIYLAVQKLIIMPYVQAHKEQWVIIHNYCSETTHFPETPVFTLPQFLWWWRALTVWLFTGTWRNRRRILLQKLLAGSKRLKLLWVK